MSLLFYFPKCMTSSIIMYKVQQQVASTANNSLT